MLRRRFVRPALFAVVGAAVLVPLGATYGRGLAERGPEREQVVALGTDFTFQGKLADNGTPADGTYDFTFYLYDALAGGSQVGPAQVEADVSVSGGLFTVTLDFGAVFDGSKYYLEIQVRPGASGGAYNVLSPRQAVNAVPSAVYSSVAGSARALQGVGVSTAAPAAGQVLRFDGSEWAPAALPGAGLALPFSATQASGNTLFSVVNSGSSGAIRGETASEVAYISGVLGVVSSDSPGIFSAGVRGVNNGTGGAGVGVAGSHAGSGWGMYGTAENGRGVYGSSNGGTGVYGSSTTGAAGLFSSSNTALQINGPIRVGGAKPAAFEWTVTAGSLGCVNARCSNIDHPSTNNNPDAFVFVTERYSGHPTTPVAVGYWAGKWRIYALNLANEIPVGAVYHVLVINP